MITRKKYMDAESRELCVVWKCKVNWIEMMMLVVIETIVFMFVDVILCDECGTSLFENGGLAVLMVGVGGCVDCGVVLMYSLFY